MNNMVNIKKSPLINKTSDN